MKVRKAQLSDAEEIQGLIGQFVSSGDLLAVPLVNIYESIRDYFVAEEDSEVVGTVSLKVLWKDLAEVRSLSVLPHLHGKGVGRMLVNACLEEALELGIPRVFALTREGGFFETMGFVKCNKEELPQKIWFDCVRCPKFPHLCDEEAYLYRIEIAEVRQ